MNKWITKFKHPGNKVVTCINHQTNAPSNKLHPKKLCTSINFEQ